MRRRGAARSLQTPMPASTITDSKPISMPGRWPSNSRSRPPSSWSARTHRCGRSGCRRTRRASSWNGTRRGELRAPRDQTNSGGDGWGSDRPAIGRRSELVDARGVPLLSVLRAEMHVLQFRLRGVPAGTGSALRGCLLGELPGEQWPWTPETVYLGGGTPSQMEPDILGICLVWSRAPLDGSDNGSGARFADPRKGEAWRSAGINRVSLGVQSFVQGTFADRAQAHGGDSRGRCGDAARGGIGNINIDLIAGLPCQTREWWESLDWVDRSEPPHVSVYMLEVDDDSRLGRGDWFWVRATGRGRCPARTRSRNFTRQRPIAWARRHPALRDLEFRAPGFESRHNLKYWRREPYLGFGADAHSFDGVSRWQNPETAADYVERHANGLPSRSKTSAARSAKILLGLRLEQGMDAEWSAHEDAVRRFIQDGLLESAGIASG